MKIRPQQSVEKLFKKLLLIIGHTSEESNEYARLFIAKTTQLAVSYLATLKKSGQEEFKKMLEEAASDESLAAVIKTHCSDREVSDAYTLAVIDLTELYMVPIRDALSDQQKKEIEALLTKEIRSYV